MLEVFSHIPQPMDSGQQKEAHAQVCQPLRRRSLEVLLPLQSPQEDPCWTLGFTFSLFSFNSLSLGYF